MADYFRDVRSKEPRTDKDMVKREVFRIQRANMDSLLSILGRLVEVLTKINQGAYPGDIDEILNEVRDDLSEM